MDLIKKLKGNEKPFGLNTKEEQECLDKAGIGNCLRCHFSCISSALMVSWPSAENELFYRDKVYRIKPDYQPESKKPKSGIQWLTKDEVKEAAAESDEAALACSIEHYAQMCEATEEEFREAFPKKVDINGESCAICVRYKVFDSCGKCPFQVNGHQNPLWDKVNKTLGDWKNRLSSYSALHDTLKAVLQALKALQLPQVERCEVKPDELTYIRDGAYGVRVLYEAFSDPDFINALDKNGIPMEIRGGVHIRNKPAPIPFWVVFARRPK